MSANNDVTADECTECGCTDFVHDMVTDEITCTRCFTAIKLAMGDEG